MTDGKTQDGDDAEARRPAFLRRVNPSRERGYGLCRDRTLLAYLGHDAPTEVGALLMSH